MSDRDGCFDDVVAETIVLGPIDDPAREGHLSHAELCDACLGRLSRATERLVSRGPDPSVPDPSVPPPSVLDTAAPSETASEPVAGLAGLIGQRYVVLDTLGRGGMGVVHLAHDTVLGREVALKVVRHKLAHTSEMLRSEAHALAAINHPNVIKVYDLVADGGRLAIAMERVRGMTLRQRVRRGMRPRARIRALLAMTEGVRAAHAAGVVHGDIKLDNVLVDDASHVRIADFGLSRLVATSDRRAGGTGLFMAPELAQGGPATLASDQFALAASWVDALADARPDPSVAAAGWRELAQRVRPRWARAPLVRALAPAPSDRHASVAALLVSVRRRRARFVVSMLALVVTALVGPWLAWHLHARAAHDACVASASRDLPEDVPIPIESALAGPLAARARAAWQGGSEAYRGWREHWTSLQSDVCANAELGPDLVPCLGFERRWIEESLRDVGSAQPMTVHTIGALSQIAAIERERLCDDPLERATVARYHQPVDGTRRRDDLLLAITVSRGPFATQAELDQVVAELTRQAPSRLLVAALLHRSLRLQRDQRTLEARADAERALEVATRLHRRDSEAAAALRLGLLAVQADGSLERARFWLRMARALTDTPLLGHLRDMCELAATIAIASGRAREVVAEVDALADDPLGVFAMSVRLLALRGVALLELGELGPAEASLRRALEVRIDDGDVDPSRLAGLINNLAALARASGDDLGAFMLLEDARGLRAYLPDDMPDRLTLDLARTRFEGEVFARPGALADAERLATATRQTFSVDHNDYVRALTLVAELARRFDAPERARAAAHEAVALVVHDDLQGELGASPYLVLAELDDDALALDSARRRLGAVLPSAPLCPRLAALARSLGASAGTCAGAPSP